MTTTMVYRVIYASKTKQGDKSLCVTASSVANAIAAVQAADTDAGTIITVTQQHGGVLNVGS